MPIKFGENTSIITESDLKLSSISKIVFNNSNGASEYAEIDAAVDGTNGGQLRFLTKVDNGNVTEKLRINNAGAIGIGTNPNFGTDGQVLTSQGTNPAIWRAVAPPTPDFLLFDIGTQQDLNVNQFNIITPTYSFGGTASANNHNNITIDPATGIITFANTGTYVIYANFMGYWGNSSYVNVELYPGTVTIPSGPTQEAYVAFQRPSGSTREAIGFSGLPVNITVANTTKRFWVYIQGGSSPYLQAGSGTCGSIIRIV